MCMCVRERARLCVFFFHLDYVHLRLYALCLSVCCDTIVVVGARTGPVAGCECRRFRHVFYRGRRTRCQNGNLAFFPAA